MTEPYEATLSGATLGLSIYTVMRSKGLFTKAAILSYINSVELAHGARNSLSSAYADGAVTFLVNAGHVTFDGTTITHTHSVAGLPAPIRRVAGNDALLERVP